MGRRSVLNISLQLCFRRMDILSGEETVKIVLPTSLWERDIL